MYRLLAALLTILLAVPALAEDETHPAVNDVCPVRGEPVSVEAGTVEYRKEQIGFCCAECVATFRGDPVRYVNRFRLNPRKYGYRSSTPNRLAMRKAALRTGVANGLCPVTEKVVVKDAGSASYREQTIGFATPAARQAFLEDPEPWMRALRADPLAYGYKRPGPTHAQLRMAREAASSVNGLCPVMGNAVKPNGGFTVVDGERVAFCCPGCEAKFVADTARYLGLMREEPAVYGYLPAPR